MTGCSDGTTDHDGAGGTGAVGGSGGAGGTAGTWGMGGMGGAPLDAGLYVMDCSVDVGASSRIPFPVEFTLHANVDPALTAGAASTLTSSAEVWIGPDIIVTGSFEAMYSAAEVVLMVQGAEPTEIVHGLASVGPVSRRLETDIRTTEMTPDGTAETVTVEITQFSVTITGLPEELFPGGELIFPNEDYECGDIVLREGSSIVAFPVSP